uniref:Uncharacterized protein n=1 Tax=Nelumbo nucifera TaxID=4432 RepID=A0A822XVG2_NELNU|nr:TPA_asm: hypothetical protein HUJ06_022891 [Nelumbo nucifera]
MRALIHPTWSWRQDIQQMLDGLKSAVSGVLERIPTSSTIRLHPCNLDLL